MKRIRLELSVWEDARGNIHLASVDRKAHPTLSAYVQGDPGRANYHAKLYAELRRALESAGKEGSD